MWDLVFFCRLDYTVTRKQQKVRQMLLCLPFFYQHGVIILHVTTIEHPQLQSINYFPKKLK